MDVKNKALFEKFISKRESTVLLTPWDRRTETKTAKSRRYNDEWENEKLRRDNLMKEKSYSIDRYVISGNKRYIVASFFAHHLVVFSIPDQEHLHTLFSEHSLLHLYVAAISYDGQYLVHTNYDEKSQIAFVTLWDCFKGNICKKLKGENGVCAIDITPNADRVLFGKESSELCLWSPFLSKTPRWLRGYGGMNFTPDGRCSIKLFQQGSRALVRAGGFSIWDLDAECLLSVITPDKRVECWELALDDQLLVMGIREIPEPVICKLLHKTAPRPQRNHLANIFGEGDDSTDSSEDDERS